MTSERLVSSMRGLVLETTLGSFPAEELLASPDGIKDIAYRFAKGQFVAHARVEVDGVIGLTSETLVAFVSGERRYPSTEQLDKIIALIQKIHAAFHSRHYWYSLHVWVLGFSAEVT